MKDKIKIAYIKNLVENNFGVDKLCKNIEKSDNNLLTFVSTNNKVSFYKISKNTNITDIYPIILDMFVKSILDISSTTERMIYLKCGIKDREELTELVKKNFNTFIDLDYSNNELPKKKIIYIEMV